MQGLTAFHCFPCSLNSVKSIFSISEYMDFFPKNDLTFLLLSSNSSFGFVVYSVSHLFKTNLKETDCV